MRDKSYGKGRITHMIMVMVACILLSSFRTVSGQGKIEVNISIDFSDEMGAVNPVWRFFGCDEPNYATLENGRKLLNDLGDLRPGEVYFRTHNLLNTGNGESSLKWGSTNAYTEDENGNPVYNWNIVDSIFDAYLSNGVKPYVEIGFMPEALSVKPEPYRHHWNPDLPYGEIYTGWAYPPDDYGKWKELVFRWVSHCVERYGREEVETWYWETWNEPNIGYWRGTRDEFLKLHDYAVEGVLEALPSARVGGPDVAGYGGNYSRAFLDHCLSDTNYATGTTGTKIDFFSFHAKGSPVYVDGHVRMNMANQLNAVVRGFRLISSYPDLKGIPVVIGESDPEGCAACQGESLGYRNGTMYSSYTAASIVRIMDLALQYDVNLKGSLTWAFEFEDQPIFAGFRSLASNGINKPVYNTFRIFSMMDGTRVRVASDHEVPIDTIVRRSVRNDPDVSAFASTDGEKLYIMLWHYHDDDIEGPDARIRLRMDNIPVRNGKLRTTCYLVDGSHSNAYTKWIEMGSPAAPSLQQKNILLEESELALLPDLKSIKVKNGQADVTMNLRRQGVALIVADLK